ncbi:MAG: hypothetical protein JW757_09790 [Anaerolineales bacterium]|nr:hypothetical protein [Anaerolineales bacterium]
MKPTWLFSWELDQQAPAIEYNQDDETISFAAFPENGNSFVLIEGFLFDRHNFKASQSATDAERVIEYYKIFRQDLFLKLRGAYSLVIWDAAERCLIAGRDHMGQIPFYYFWNQKRIIISSSIQALLKQPGVDHSFNRVVIAEYLLDRYPNAQRTETCFQQLQRLPPAHDLKISCQQLVSARYWDPIPPGFQWVEKKAAACWIDLFEQAVQRCISAGADSLLMSGGLDSVSIAVMANKINQYSNRQPIHAISGAFPNTGADEGEVQAAVAHALNIPITIWHYDDQQGNKSILLESLDMIGVGPSPNYNFNQSYTSRHMKNAGDGNLSKAMWGTGGDELFYIDFSWATDLFFSFRLIKLAQYLYAYSTYEPGSAWRSARYIYWRYSMRPALSSVAGKLLGRFYPAARNFLRPNKNPIYPAWVNDADHKLWDSINDRREATSPATIGDIGSRLGQYKRNILSSPRIMDTIETRYFFFRDTGFSSFYPFFDLDLMDLALRINPVEFIKNGLVKSPLREFLQTNLPSVSLPYKKTYYPLPHNLLREEGKLAWLAFGGVHELEKIGIIDRNLLNKFMESYFNIKHEGYDQTWRILAIEAWLRAYRPLD